ncbi:MAG: hypothetical protein Q9179_001146 [Wetmoreana sp. 5 TL-2023]
MENSTAKRSSSRNRPPSRPTTPIRPSSRTSLRESQTFTPGGTTSSPFPLESLEPAFAELSDSMADLEANFMHLQLMHESLSRFNENFASFLYGLNMNVFCVDFPEAPIPESFKRARQAEDSLVMATPSKNDKGGVERETSTEPENEASFLSLLLLPPRAQARYSTSEERTQVLVPEGAEETSEAQEQVGLLEANIEVRDKRYQIQDPTAQDAPATQDYSAST